MSVTVRIPTTLRPLSGGNSTVSVEGATLGEVLANLEAAHPGFKDRLFDDNGGLRRFVNLFVADDDVRYLQGLETPVPAGNREHHSCCCWRLIQEVQAAEVRSSKNSRRRLGPSGISAGRFSRSCQIAKTRFMTSGLFIIASGDVSKLRLRMNARNTTGS